MEIEILMEGKGMQHAITKTKATTETISREPEGTCRDLGNGGIYNSRTMG